MSEQLYENDADTDDGEDQPKARAFLRGVSPAIQAVAQIERILCKLLPNDQRRVINWFTPAQE